MRTYCFLEHEHQREELSILLLISRFHDPLMIWQQKSTFDHDLQPTMFSTNFEQIGFNKASNINILNWTSDYLKPELLVN